MPWLTILDDYFAAIHDEYAEKKFQIRLAGLQLRR